MALRIFLAATLAAATLSLMPVTATADPGACSVDPSAPVDAQCGQDPAAPTPPPAPPPVRVYLCHDGAFEFTQYPSRRKTCSRHGGAIREVTGGS